MSDILGKIKGLFANRLDLKDQNVKEEARIIDDLGADSLDIVEMVVILEEDFDIEIPSEEAEKMLTVGDVTKYIEDRCASLV
ncbi:MAG: acyl carrier protein [Candidatus Omnitrophota bacterium]|nr:acyl carrier protein [Candidatus Omnitrophota bacterium]